MSILETILIMLVIFVARIRNSSGNDIPPTGRFARRPAPCRVARPVAFPR